MNMVIFGPQGAGKGTQGVRLAEKYDVPAISTGDIFRWAISRRTSLGQEAREYVEKGSFVPDDVTIGVVRERLSADDAKDGFLLDGFPRNIIQAVSLDEVLQAKGQELYRALAVEVPEDVSLRRILGRRVCAECGRNYHVDSPPQEDWICDRCGGRVEGRGDDQHESMIRSRLQLYHEQTEPLKAYYEAKGVLRQIDGVGTPDEVFDRIVASL